MLQNVLINPMVEKTDKLKGTAGQNDSDELQMRSRTLFLQERLMSFTHDWTTLCSAKPNLNLDFSAAAYGAEVFFELSTVMPWSLPWADMGNLEPCKPG
ncbi:unnamed protein product [Caretta caretta]